MQSVLVARGPGISCADQVPQDGHQEVEDTDSGLQLEPGIWAGELRSDPDFVFEQPASLRLPGLQVLLRHETQPRSARRATSQSYRHSQSPARRRSESGQSGRRARGRGYEQ